MDAEHFDALIRSIDQCAPRRAILRVLGGGVAALLTHPSGEDAEAGKKKRKKHKKPRKGNKPGNKPGTKLSCPSGAKTCGETCIPAANCCGNADCGSGMACREGACVCHAGLLGCGTHCVSGDQCCFDTDCPIDYVCDDGYCSCPHADDIPCGNLCCAAAFGDICAIVGSEAICQSGGCPTTDVCTDLNIYLCGQGLTCATTIDNVNVCSDFGDIHCIECASDADCVLAVGPQAVCIPHGPHCAGSCASTLTAFCVAPEPGDGRRGGARARRNADTHTNDGAKI